jgi:superfamily II DNA or RNA helicase
MSYLRDLPLKTNYRKGEDDIAKDFYLPCMACASRYDRAVGFFGSAIYVIAWPVLKDFVQRGSTMRLICSPVLTGEDVDAIADGYSARGEQEAAAEIAKDIRDMLSTPYLYKPTKVLASLVAMGTIDIRVAFMPRGSHSRRIFHEKLGLFRDDAGNVVDFKGSMNETWAGLSSDGNLESIDVFLSWEHAREAKRVREDEQHFEKLWEDTYEGVNVRKFPDIAREELIAAADKTNWADLVDEICRDIAAVKPFTASSSRTLRPHQSHALLEWERRGRRGILEHATGSGKTFTALCAMRESLGRNEIPLVLVPSELLVEQWHREITQTLDDVKPVILTCGAGQTRWRDEALLRPWTRSGDRSRVVIATLQTASSAEFRSAIRQGPHIFLVADEVHRMGSPEHLKLLDLQTGPRLGLSATPRRAGDPLGTAVILEYFNGIVPPPFRLQDAIASGTLTPYMYHVHSAALTEDEQDSWDTITRRIRQASAQQASSKDAQRDEEKIKLLLIQRARILKSAENKTSLAVSVVQEHFTQGERWIVYCDNLEQLSKILTSLRQAGIKAGEYHSTMTGDREQTITLFERNGGILVSIRCLDEGIDIPSVSHALIVASSRNPREFIQRRGRVLRKAPGKNLAHIHDIVIVPRTRDEEDPSVSILMAEMVRAIEFGKGALNPSAVTELERIALQYGLDYEQLLGTGYEEDE